jgi:hypothetical protein
VTLVRNETDCWFIEVYISSCCLLDCEIFIFFNTQSNQSTAVAGDIKCENVLVTSWNWVYLADYYGSLKPTLLPADNPADFSFFFDTGGRRRCYLAPEVESFFLIHIYYCDTCIANVMLYTMQEYEKKVYYRYISFSLFC